MKRLRPSGIMLVASCFALISMSSCFLFSGSKDATTGLSMGDMTSFEVASTLRDAGRYDEALRVYLAVIGSDSTSLAAANSMNEIAGIYILQNEYGKALDMYNRLATNFPVYQDIDMVHKKIEFVETAQRVVSERQGVARDDGGVRP